jgi:Protein of unknown function (DUF4054)
MAFDKDQFRIGFPEFTSDAFSNDQVVFWGELADAEISSTRFGQVREKAVDLLTAHYLSMAKLNASGANPGAGGALTSSKRVGDVSVSYDNSAITGATGSAYSGTRYGAMLSAMMRRYGAGCVQL